MSNPAYFIFDVAIQNTEGMKPYQAEVANILAQYNGTLLVGAGTVEAKEGIPPQGNIFVVRFDSMDAANAWYNSPEYQHIITHRHASAKTDAFIVEGLPL